MIKVLKYTGLALVLLLMIAAVFTYVAPHLGCRVDTVVSGSMEPAIKTYSLLVTRAIDPADIEVGDIITFRRPTSNDTLITHRVIGITRNSPIAFVTKGDANIGADPHMVPESNLEGKVSFSIPYGGYVIEFLRTLPGFIFGLLVPGLIITAVLIISMVREIIDDVVVNINQ